MGGSQEEIGGPIISVGKVSRVRWAMLAMAGLAFTPSSLIASETGSDPARAGLQVKLEALAQRAQPGVLGITALDLPSGTEWRVHAGRAYPLMSVFKAPLAATVLEQIDRGQLSFEQPVTLTRADLGYGMIRDNFHGDRETFTVRQLLGAAVSHSDNSAADALVRLVGGPQVVTAFLRTHGIDDMRVDLDEHGVARIFANLGSVVQHPSHETPAEKERRLQGGLQAFLADPRNRSTPDSAVIFLRKLSHRELVSPASTQYLLGLMEAQKVPHRLRDGLPADVRLADKTGTSDTVQGVTAAYNDIGILTWPDGHTVIVAAFLTGSKATSADRDALFAELGRDIAEALHP